MPNGVDDSNQQKLYVYQVKDSFVEKNRFISVRLKTSVSIN